jgi:hypothetical protein
MSDRLLCATARCHSRQHKPDCAGEECRGCLPYPAADGWYLCGLHGERIGQDALEAARLFAELEHRMVGAGGNGDKVRSEPGSKYPDQRAIDVRTEIRHTLASWCRLVAEDRGFTLPAGEVSAMGEFVAQHATWLAAQPFAAEVSDELHALRQKAWSAAYPSGSSRRDLHKPCPLEECTGSLMAVMRPSDAVLPPEVFCSINEEHRWASSEWRQLDRLVLARRAA